MKFEFAPRKIQKLGKSFYICIPQSWLHSLDIKEGDKLQSTIMDDGTLTIKKC